MDRYPLRPTGLTVVVILLAYRLARRIDGMASVGLNEGHLARLTTTVAAIALLQFTGRVLDDAVNLTGRVARYGTLRGHAAYALVFRSQAVGWSPQFLGKRGRPHGNVR